MMDDHAERCMPRVEALLVTAHREHLRLRERRAALMRCGIASDHLPDDNALMAFALLADRERGALAESLQTDWPMLESKGLARAAMADVSTPELRLLKTALPLTDSIDDVWQRLQEAAQAPEPPQGVLRCTSRVQGRWGQPAQLHLSVGNNAYVRIAPDPIFRQQPAVLAADRSGRREGSFTFPIEDGEIAIILLQRSGEVFRHTVRSVVEGLN